MKASISLEELKAQNIILHARTVRETKGEEEGMMLELALNGRVDFGPALAEKRREQERKALVKEIERRVRETQAKEEVMSKAEHYAATDPAIAEMLAKLKEMN